MPGWHDKDIGANSYFVAGNRPKLRRRTKVFPSLTLDESEYFQKPRHGGPMRMGYGLLLERKVMKTRKLSVTRHTWAVRCSVAHRAFKIVGRHYDRRDRGARSAQELEIRPGRRPFSAKRFLKIVRKNNPLPGNYLGKSRPEREIRKVERWAAWQELLNSPPLCHPTSEHKDLLLGPSSALILCCKIPVGGRTGVFWLRSFCKGALARCLLSHQGCPDNGTN